jgi:hypothetical protein
MHVALDPCFFTTKPKKLESCLLSMSSRDGIHGDLNFMALLTVEMIAKHGQISQNPHLCWRLTLTSAGFKSPHYERGITKQLYLCQLSMLDPYPNPSRMFYIFVSEIF